jgi:hypothetical protein
MTYEGFDVLTETTHNMRAAIAEAFGRVGALLTNATGVRLYDDRSLVAVPVRSFLWSAFTRAECLALRAFLEARLGRLVPFWTPTFQNDLIMVADLGPAITELVIKDTGYVAWQWPKVCRRRLALVKRDGSFYCRKVVDVEDNGDGTHSLFLDAAIGETLIAAHTQLSFLVLCRLERDMNEIVWSRNGLAEAELAFQELPLEVPA